jgi:tight adherence protein C
LRHDLPATLDLLGVAAAAGCNARLAIEAVCHARDGPSVEALRAALVDATSGGARLADALARLPDAHGDRLRPLTRVLIDAERYGTPLGPALEAAAQDARHEARRRAEERARRLPVRLLLPLVLCVLPAFALLTVAPLVVSGVRALTDQSPAIPPTPIIRRQEP